MKGHHPTPPGLARRMTEALFEGMPPTSGSRILYPGCGTAPFAEATEEVCKARGWPLPEGCAVETDPGLLAAAEQKGLRHVTFVERDFLAERAARALGRFDYILGNPPYVPLGALSEAEKARYRSTFATAVGRFDLYLLFFERALSLLAPGGRLSFVTPEKWEYVQTAAPLRKMLSGPVFHVEQVEHIRENAFEGLVTYPAVTTVRRLEESDGLGRSSQPPPTTRVALRDGTEHTLTLPEESGSSWAALIRGEGALDTGGEMDTGVTLGDVTVRVSPGMATGADAEFVVDAGSVPDELASEWTRPTVSGRELAAGGDPAWGESVLLCPYRDDGSLAPESELGAFGRWASARRERLEDRSCVKKHGKAWYAWHETPPMDDLLRPKIVFKDIAKTPQFWPERAGNVVPRHSVYYMVPEDGREINALLEYLNSAAAARWMQAHCQRAANGFLRLQSRVLRKLPVPKHLQPERQAAEPMLF